MTVRIRLIALAIALLGAGPIAASPDPIVLRTPHEALGLLKAGNDRFARNVSVPVSLSVNRRRELAEAQHPMAMVLRARIRACRPSTSSTPASAICSSSARRAR
jgi:hypothetical protein